VDDGVDAGRFSQLLLLLLLLLFVILLLIFFNCCIGDRIFWKLLNLVLFKLLVGAVDGDPAN
jgi:hypothetical protein